MNEALNDGATHLLAAQILVIALIAAYMYFSFCSCTAPLKLQ